jgi:hypothetical protein
LLRGISEGRITEAQPSACQRISTPWCALLLCGSLIHSTHILCAGNHEQWDSRQTRSWFPWNLHSSEETKISKYMKQKKDRHNEEMNRS